MRKSTRVRSHVRAVQGKPVVVRSHLREKEGPHSKEFLRVPTAKDVVWDYAVQEHAAKRAGLHYDLRLADGSGKAHSWALRHLPEPGQTSFAAQTFTHEAGYMHFEGTLKGYGAGSVKLHDRSRAYIHYAGDERIMFSVIKGRSTQDYALIRTKGKNWLLHNMSLPDDQVPRGKETYKEVEFGLSLIDKHPDAVVAAKLDGAHTRIIMRPGKRTRAFSHRESKVGDKLEYTHKISGLYDLKAPGGEGDTILTGEVLAIGLMGRPAPPTRTTALLNATVLNSKAMQNETGELLVPYLFDVQQYQGKPMQDAPYLERQKILRKIADKHPVFKLAPVAITRAEKEKLITQIAERTHPLTTEGVVLWEKRPIKAKIKQEYDIFIRDIFEGEGKLVGKAGGFFYSHTANGPVVGKVGTGFSDNLREDMWNRKKHYIGLVARTTALGRYPSGALEKPSFSEWHVEKNIGDKDSLALLTSEFEAILKQVGVKKDEVQIGGSGVFGALGLKNVGDLDVTTSPPVYRKLRAHPLAKRGVGKSGDPKVQFDTPAGEIEVFTGKWMTAGEDFAERNEVLKHKGWHFWSPEKVLRWKRAMGRLKDANDIKLLTGAGYGS